MYTRDGQIVQYHEFIAVERTVFLFQHILASVHGIGSHFPVPAIRQAFPAGKVIKNAGQVFAPFSVVNEVEFIVSHGYP